MIALIDANNFYVSCERIFDPALVDRALLVLSNNDGCVISRSAEVKALGIPMGLPYFQLKPLLHIHNIIVKSSNYALYADISRRIVEVLQTFSANVEPYSIDEAFLHFKLQDSGNYYDYGIAVRKKLLQWIGIPCGIGIASSKTLAKAANQLAKKSPSGVFVMPEDSAEILTNFMVGEIWGIGRKTSAKLQKIGINNAWQLANCQQEFLRKKFNVNVARTALELLGKAVISEEDPEEAPQSVSCSRSFSFRVESFEHLKEATTAYICRAAEKLRAEKQLAAGVNIYFQYFCDKDKSNYRGYYSSTSIIFPQTSSNSLEILRYVKDKLPALHKEGRKYKKAGVIFFGLEPEINRQQNLFREKGKEEKNIKLFSAIDRLNQKLGRGTVFSLSEGIAKPWAMKRDFLSESYTTNWEQIPKVR